MGRIIVVPFLLRELLLSRTSDGNMVNAPATDYAIDRWADEIGTSSRTPTRHFENETGMSFGQYLPSLSV